MSQNCTVFVGNLSWETGEASLAQCMAAAGAVASAQILRTHSGRSKGSAVVRYEAPDAAGLAIETLTDTELDGRKIFVREYRDNSAPPVSVREYRDNSAPPVSVSGVGTQVFVGNLAFSVDWQQLKDHMRPAGNVVHADIMTNKGGKSRGCGIVRFESPDDAQTGRPIEITITIMCTAIDTLNGSELDGREISLRLFNEEREQELVIQIDNLPDAVSWKDLKDYLRGAAPIARVDIVGPNSAVAKFRSHKFLSDVLSLQSVPFQGHHLTFTTIDE